MPLLRWNMRFTRYVDLPYRFFVLPSASPRGLSHLHDLHLTCYDSLCRRPYILPMRWVQTRRLDQRRKIIYLKQGRASRRSRLTESERKGFRIHAPNQVIKHGANTRAKLRPEEGILWFEKDLWTTPWLWGSKYKENLLSYFLTKKERKKERKGAVGPTLIPSEGKPPQWCPARRNDWKGFYIVSRFTARF